MNKLVAGAIGAALMFGAASANAAQIQGSIGMVGTVAIAGPFSTATFLDFLPPGGGSGSFLTLTSTGDIAGAGIGLGDSGTIQDLTFSPFAGPILSFYTVTDGLNTLSFDLESLVVTTQNDNTIAMTGTGTMHLTGFDDTTGIWKFSTQSGSNTGTFTWSADGFSVVPEPATLALFGAGLVGLGMIRRRKA